MSCGGRFVVGRTQVGRFARGALVIATLGVLCWSGTPAFADEGGPRLAVVPSKAEYAPGEAVSLTVTVTNGSAAACRLAVVPDGTLSVVSVRRDGAALPASFGRISYAQERTVGDATDFRVVGAGQGVSFRWDGAADTADGEWLSVAAGLPGQDSLTTWWSVSAAGRYAVSVIYRSPGGRAGVPAGCARSTGLATAEFTVRAPSGARFPAWLVVLVAAGAVAVVIVLLLLLRRHARAGRVAAVLVWLAGLLGAAVIVAPRADARIVTIGPHGFKDEVKECLNDIKNTKPVPAKTGDPVPDYAAFIRRLRDPGTPLIRIKLTHDPDGHGIPPKWPYTHTETEPGGTTTYWDPVAHFDYTDGSHTTNCNLLYHELLHADYKNLGQENNDWCGHTGLPVNEVEVILRENLYRIAHHLRPRTNHTVYDGSPDGDKSTGIVPPSVDDCYAPGKRPGCSDGGPGFFTAPPVRLAAAPACSDPGGNPASTDGDPHLTTFDQLYYDFQAVGEFTAARSGDDFEVQTRQAPLPFSTDRTVSVNTAVALRVGTDRVGFYLDDGTIAVHRNGRPATVGSVPQPLTGGGTIRRRQPPSTGGDSPDGYTVRWPDGSRADVDVIGRWGIRLLVDPAAARHGRLAGLLGNFDGDLTNDLRTRAGAQLPDHPSFDQLYRTLAGSWRLTPAESLFDYPAGQSTRTFTDLSFPAAPADLPEPQRDRAAVACGLAGVANPHLLDACILDVARTGQVAFAVNAADTQYATRAPVPPRPTPPLLPTSTPQPTAPKGPDGPLATLRDGDTVRPDQNGGSAGRIGVPGERDRYNLDLGGATEFRLVNRTGDVEADLIGPDGSPHASTGATLPGADSFHLGRPGRYQLQVTGGAPGPYSFEIVTDKLRTMPTTVGETIHGHLDLPGRIDLYRFRAATGSLHLTAAAGCADLSAGFADDEPQPRVYSPFDLCGDIQLGDQDAHRPRLLVIWSNHAQPADYTITLGPT
jgi:von Willebrand factor type D domain